MSFWRSMRSDRLVRAGRLSLGAILVLTGTAMPAFAGGEKVIVTGERESDPCLVVAKAKAAQWNQIDLRKHETKTFADGHTAWTDTIMTRNTVFRRTNHVPWQSIPVTRGQRRAGSPAHIEKTMGLANCRIDDQAASVADDVTAYRFDYGPDKDGSRPAGRILISDRSGLPTRQEMVATAPSASGRLPVKISVDYSYGKDAKVPSAARRADYRRHQDIAQCLRQMQLPAPNSAPAC